MSKKLNIHKLRNRAAQAAAARREVDEARAATQVQDENDKKSDPLNPLIEKKLLLCQRAQETKTPLLELANVTDPPPLYAAIAAGDVASVRALIANGACVTETLAAKTKKADVEGDVGSDVDLVPMDVALSGENPDVIAALLGAGAAPDGHWLFHSWLHAYVTLYPAATALTYQMDAGPKATVVGQRAHIYRRHPNFVKIAKLLMVAGADPHAHDDYEETTAAAKAAKYKIRELEDLFGEPPSSPPT